MAGMSVGRGKLTAEVTQTEAFPPERMFVFAHIILCQGHNHQTTQTLMTIKASRQELARQGFFCLFSHFSHCALTNASTLLAVFAGFSTSPITTLHVGIPNQFHPSVLDFLFSDLLFSE